MPEPTPSAAERIAEIRSTLERPCDCTGGQSLILCERCNAMPDDLEWLLEYVTSALDAERAKVWEEAAKRFAECAVIARQAEQEPDSPAYWAHEGMYRAYKHAESIATQESRAAEVRR